MKYLCYPHKHLYQFCGARKCGKNLFLKNIILVDTGNPLSAHMHTYTILIVDHILLRERYCIFGPQQKKPARGGKVGLSL